MNPVGPVLDWWILPHFGLFCWIASSVRAKWVLPFWAHLVLWFVLSFGWEGAEHYLQRAYIDTWVVVEHPLNAWVVDPVSNGVGWVVGVLVARWSKGRKR